LTTLEHLPVLLLDAQATAADPSRGALLEIGWLPWNAGAGREPTPEEVTARVIAAPPGAAVPPTVARVTGLRTEDWERGEAPALAWQRLRSAAQHLAARQPALVVVHFARFETPYLHALHARHGSGSFPFRLVCSHAIARHLLPELPRRTLRALAGYFGGAVGPLRRSTDHVIATALVWRHLVALLAEREGITDLEALDAWLARPAPRRTRQWPLPRERRRQLPGRPGVYRLHRLGGAVLYVGKATSLRQRVSGHFHGGAGLHERALEMLTQVRDVSWLETESPLEAALLESDEIKRIAPPFNVALVSEGRGLWFASPDLQSLRDHPDNGHPIGPLASRLPLEALSALREVIARAPRPATLALRSRAVGVDPPYAPEPECFAEGLARFLGAHTPVTHARGLLRLGERLWAARLASTPVTAERDDSILELVASEAPRRPAWEPARVEQSLEQTVLRASHAVRRGRWLCRLSECALAWQAPGAPGRRLLVFERGQLADRGHLAAGAALPIPSGHARSLAERLAAFDVGMFDRLRVLTTELRGLAANGAGVELRLGPFARLSACRLRAALRWV